ncbi:Putative ribosome biogenesis GTPase RsgA [Clostridiales bacterium CHKCI006]|nr:Putative ribosome biogenesis GTPase RsgA [Clostridiales bacterium CHKCI006]
MDKGRIIRSLSGFYTVASQEQTVICKARGRFRKDDLKPLVGDWCQFIVDAQGQGYIMEIEKRKNVLVRPPVANIDQALIFVSWRDPDFSSLLLDRFLAVIENKGIEPVIMVTKVDLADDAQETEKVLAPYRQAGYRLYELSSQDGRGLADMQGLFQDKVSVLTGQSGVGKSSLLNALDSKLTLQIGEISTALGRGRHTTRHVELFGLLGGWVADTPGFSSLILDMSARELACSYHDFAELSASCKYRGCLHQHEPSCAIKQAVSDGKISQERYEHYLMFLNEIQQRKEKY